ncbi:MAG: hypothetical protein PUK42_01840 [Prevotellaceae bacterium]|nr:hypothetical protein [Prevotella sp.]MDD7420383.1 hypothetical protein [Prevotellaceae bacterium]MDY5947223.1 hypothetical protein [Prevotella sp.]
MKKEYMTPQALVISAETIAPIATSTISVTIVDDVSGPEYNGVFYSKPTDVWGDDEE